MCESEYFLLLTAKRTKRSNWVERGHGTVPAGNDIITLVPEIRPTRGWSRNIFGYINVLSCIALQFCSNYLFLLPGPRAYPNSLESYKMLPTK